VEKFSRDARAGGDRLLVNAARLSRLQQLDACGVCHASIYKTLNPMVSFRTGDTLAMVPMENLDTTGKIDVHGNQYGLLKRSKCFTASATMTCSSCHDPHKNERGNEALFSQRCMSCHTDKNTDFAKMAPGMAIEQVKQKCITCHMPNQESKVLNVRLDQNGQRTPAVMRSHLIRVYPDTIPSIAALYLKSMQ
jgi:mono/diheme cytochrome c family protein